MATRSMPGKFLGSQIAARSVAAPCLSPNISVPFPIAVLRRHIRTCYFGPLNFVPTDSEYTQIRKAARPSAATRPGRRELTMARWGMPPPAFALRYLWTSSFERAVWSFWRSCLFQKAGSGPPRGRYGLAFRFRGRLRGVLPGTDRAVRILLCH